MTDQPDTPSFSPGTLRVFEELLGGFSLPATHPQFEEIAAAVGLAKRELAAALATTTSISNRAQRHSTKRRAPG